MGEGAGPGGDLTAIPFPRDVAVIGLGYVGLPLAVAFARALPTLAFDVDPQRLGELAAGMDRNGEVPGDALRTPGLRLTGEPGDLAEADAFIVTVPTPLDSAKRPDLSHLLAASRTVGAALRARANLEDAAERPALVVYESTVYPGCTEEVCVPALARASGLAPGTGFRVAYSPERINPGDPDHGLDRVVKVVSADDPGTLDLVAELYGRIVHAGVHRAESIRVAEAAKVIENTQRDLNIALMNELAMFFHVMGIDTGSVLRAARSKWNFLPFEPGLVGGHCIPVDPYYLTHKAAEIGYPLHVVLAGRRINDDMGVYVAKEAIRKLIETGRPVKGARALVLGLAFKEDVPDARNTRVVDLVREIQSYGVETFVDDATLGKEGVKACGLTPPPEPPFGDAGTAPGGGGYDAVILAVPHRAYRSIPPEAYPRLLRPDGAPGLVVDVKRVLDRGAVERAGASYWSL